MKIRKGNKEDLSQILELIKELAEYEKAPEQVNNSVARMEEDGFGEKPIFEFFVAEEGQDIVGTAIFYYRYSTWKKLLDAIVNEAKRVDARQVMWQVLDWNEPAINFYKKLGTDLDEGWINCKLEYDQIQNYSTD
jgi:hypothetical protein